LLSVIFNVLSLISLSELDQSSQARCSSADVYTARGRKIVPSENRKAVQQKTSESAARSTYVFLHNLKLQYFLNLVFSLVLAGPRGRHGHSVWCGAVEEPIRELVSACTEISDKTAATKAALNNLEPAMKLYVSNKSKFLHSKAFCWASASAEVYRVGLVEQFCNNRRQSLRLILISERI